MSFAGVRHLLMGGGDSILLGGGGGVILLGGNVEDRGSVFPRRKISYKKPPTFTEAMLAEAALAEQSRIEAAATRFAMDSVPIEEADEDDLSDEMLMALTIRLLH